MKKIIGLLCIIMLGLLLTGCGSTPETTNANNSGKDSLYVFDEIPQDTTAKALEITPIGTPDPAPVTIAPVKKNVFFVQIGAFSTEDKAKEFVEIAKKKLKKEFKVFYSQKLQLHVVQIMPAFQVKNEAESYRNELWKMKEFKDAWIALTEE